MLRNRNRHQPIEIPIAWNGDGAIVEWRRATTSSLRSMVTPTALVVVGILVGWIARGVLQ